jgi:CheY-like chemotaxis protein
MTGAIPGSDLTRPTTVLLVEDEQAVGEVYRLALGRAGYDVLIASDGHTALELAKSTVPDFIFLDMVMPGMSGVEVLTRLAQDVVTRDIPVVILSNNDETRLIEQSRHLGAKEYLLKAGAGPLTLAAVVSRWLSSAAEDSRQPV